MVNTRRMILQNSGVRPKNKTEVKRLKTTTKLNLNKKKKKIHFSSTEELLKLCRPFTVSIKRFSTLHTSMKKNEGMLLA